MCIVFRLIPFLVRIKLKTKASLIISNNDFDFPNQIQYNLFGSKINPFVTSLIKIIVLIILTIKTTVVIKTKIKTITDTCPCKDLSGTKRPVIYENVDAPAPHVGTRTVT